MTSYFAALRRRLVLPVTAIVLLVFQTLAAPLTAQDIDYADVTVKRSPAGITASYVLPAPAREFTFHEILTENGPNASFRDVLRDNVWILLDPGMQLAAGVVSRIDGRPFDHFSIKISPDRSDYGRIYPALVPLGEGVVVGAEYLAAARTQMATRVTFISGGDDIIIAGEQQPAEMIEIFINQALSYADLDTDEYVVFMGPGTYFVDGLVRAVVDPAAPQWVVDMVLAEAEASIEFYEEKFAEKISAAPTFLITYVAEGYRAGWRGNVSAAGLIAMRLKGEGWTRQSPLLRRELALFVSHEVNHIWNGRRYPSNPGDTWLFEGGAEYMAVKSLHARGSISDADLERLLARSANRCLWYRTANAQIVQDMAPTAVYDCGTFIQWIAESALAQGEGDVFSIWRELFSIAAQESLFDTDDFLELLARSQLGGQAIQAISLIMEDGAAGRLDKVPELVASLGIPVQDRKQ